jgi:Ca2+-transporting ATPase
VSDAISSPHALDVEGALSELRSRREGLDDSEAADRLRQVGPNALRTAKPLSAWRILRDQLRSTVVLLLVVATVIAGVAGDLVEAIAIAAVLVLNTALGFFTEIRARRAMEALLKLETPRATVIRGGDVREIDAQQVVPGDVIRLEAGQAVPADARLLEATDLLCNEAALTGESMPVLKRPEPVAAEAPIAERTDMVYKGTTVAEGGGDAVVSHTGMATELGRIGGLIAAIPDERTPLEHRLDALGRRLAWLSLAVGALVVALGALRRLPMHQMIETGIALAIAAVPEGLPAVATIAMAVGVRRMAKRHALVRRLPSVETLGSVTVVCADKTGTLTAGQMTVTAFAFADQEVEVTGEGYAPDGEFHVDGKRVEPLDNEPLAEALRIGMLANHADVTREGDAWTVRGDPTEAALLVAASKAGLSREELLAEQPLAGEVPFSSERMLMATFHQTGEGIVAMVKGAPAQIVERCAHVLTNEGPQPLDEAGKEGLLERNRALASRGLRVLGLASGSVSAAEEEALADLTFVAFSGTLDPPAEGVRETIQLLRDAGIRTVMITGDQQLTAEAVARDLGILDAEDEVLDGKALGELSESELPARIERAGAFSRVSPEDKLTIVSAYQGDGAIVAMLGDGVNDAPALRKADIGVAMGTRGTDVAKEAAGIVLQDDRFRTIGAAVEEGRVIFDNIRKFVFYLFSCNLAEVCVLLGAGLAGLPIPLLPLQILWLNLITDTFPALSLAMEPADPDVMRRAPRDPQEAILSRRFAVSIAAFAVLLTAVTIAGFMIGLEGSDTATPRAMTMSFMTLALAQTFHLVNARGRTRATGVRSLMTNRYAIGAIVLVVALQVIALHTPPLADLLGVQPLSVSDWGIVVALAFIPVAVGQLTRIVDGFSARSEQPRQRRPRMFRSG